MQHDPGQGLRQNGGCGNDGLGAIERLSRPGVSGMTLRSIEAPKLRVNRVVKIEVGKRGVCPTMFRSCEQTSLHFREPRRILFKRLPDDSGKRRSFGLSQPGVRLVRKRSDSTAIRSDQRKSGCHRLQRRDSKWLPRIGVHKEIADAIE